MAAKTNNIELGYEIALRRFDEEDQRREGLDTKATLVLGFAGAVAGLLFNALSGIVLAERPVTLGLLVSLLFLGGLVCIVASALTALSALWLRDYLSGPGGNILLNFESGSIVMTGSQVQLPTYCEHCKRVGIYLGKCKHCDRAVCSQCGQVGIDRTVSHLRSWCWNPPGPRFA